MGSVRRWSGGLLLALFCLGADASEYPSEWRARELLGTSRSGGSVVGNYEFLRSSTSSTLPTLYRSERVALQRATLATVARRGLSLARLGAGGPWGAAALLAVEAAGWAWNSQEGVYEAPGTTSEDLVDGEDVWRINTQLGSSLEGGDNYVYASSRDAFVGRCWWRDDGYGPYCVVGHWETNGIPFADVEQPNGTVMGYGLSETQYPQGGLSPSGQPAPVSDDQMVDELLPAIDPSRWEGIMEDEQGNPIRYPEVRDMEWQLTKEDPANDAEGLPQDAPSTWAPADDPTAGDSTAPEQTEFPAFCAWAGPLCEWMEWTQEPPPEEEPPPLPTTEIDVSDGLNAWDSGLGPGACPAPMSVSLGPFGGPISIPYTAFCDFAAAIRPMVIAAGMLIGLFIVVRRV